MNDRIRRIVGFITTVVMVFSLAETIWASTCSPADGPANVIVAPEDGPPRCDGCRPAPHDEHGDDERPCPFGPVASTQSCVTAASLPASATVHLDAPTEADSSGPALDAEPELLLATTLFRPPRS
jgi:hypothetical protein